MHTTQVKLLQQAGQNDNAAWELMHDIYRPLIHSWYRGQLGQTPDIEDLTQDVFATVARELPEFDHNGQPGAFRRWLKNICMNRLLGFRRQQQLRGRPVGGSDFQISLQQVSSSEDPDKSWDDEHRVAVLRYLLSLASPHFEAQTLQIFHALTTEEKPAADVALQFGVSLGSVYVARSRVLRKMREEAIRVFGEDLDMDLLNSQSAAATSSDSEKL